MNLNKIKKSLFIACISFLSAFNAYAQNFDINLLKDINPENTNSFAWKLSSNSAYPVSLATPVVIFVFAQLKHNKHETYNAYQLAGSVVTSAIVTEGLKLIINRERPYQKYPGLIYPYMPSEKGQSFPSAHTSLAFSTATSLAIEYKKWYVMLPAYLWACSVGYSRLYLGEHYPTDVFAGAVIGAGSALLSDWLRTKFFRR